MFAARYPVVAVAALVLSSSAHAGEAGKLLPDETDLIITLDVRHLLDEHKGTPEVRAYLEPVRLALQGDETALKAYHRGHDMLRTQGLSEQLFLRRATSFKTIADALAMEPLQDLQRVTLGFRKAAWAAPVVLIEGKFKPDRFPAAVKKIAGEFFGSFKETRSGDVAVWQVPDAPDGRLIALVNDHALALTDSKEAMDDLIARAAGKKKGGLSAGMLALLEQGEKEHIAIVMNRVDAFLNDTARYLEEDVAKGLDANETTGKMALAQTAEFARKNAKDFSAASLGVSIGTENSRYLIGLVTKKAERAAEISKQFQLANLAGGLGLKAVDNNLAKQLGDILLRARVSDQDSAVFVRTNVPHEFVKAVFATDPAVLSNPSVDAAVRRLTSVRLWHPAPAAKGALEVEEIRDVAYWDSKEADPIRHRADLFLPRGKKDFPVLVLVHGGAWVIGDNRSAGLYSSVAFFLASQGIGVVLPNYRLSPGVKHPEHIRDVARAVAWTRKNIGKHGGNPDRLYILGHSAGAHLAALLTTDERYLKAEGLKTADIKGAIAVSGVYRIQHGDVQGTFLGPGTLALVPETMFPIRNDSVPLFGHVPPGLPRRFNVYGPAFGDDPKVRDDASPVNHVRHGLPPFLLLTGDHDLPTLASMADEFHTALTGAGCDARWVMVPKRNHNSLMFSAIRTEDPVAKAILQFVGKK